MLEELDLWPGTASSAYIFNFFSGAGRKESLIAARPPFEFCEDIKAISLASTVFTGSQLNGIDTFGYT